MEEKYTETEKIIISIFLICILVASVIFPIYFAWFEDTSWVFWIPVWAILILTNISWLKEDERYAAIALSIIWISCILVGLAFIVTYSYILPNDNSPFIDHSQEGPCTIIGFIFLILGIVGMAKIIKEGFTNKRKYN